MPITSSNEVYGTRLADLEKRFDAFISQDKPGSQLLTASYVAFGDPNGALTSDAGLQYDSVNNFLAIGTAPVATTLAVARGAGVNGTMMVYGTTHITHFNYSTTEDTYIRGGKAGSHVIINDIAGLGNVGIGTSAPTAKLDVLNGYIRAREGTLVPPTSGAGTELTSSGGIGYLLSFNRDTTAVRELQIYGNPTRFESGNVGIGGTPTRKLSLITTAADYISFGTASNERWLMGVEAANTGSSYLTWYDSTSGAHRMRLGPDANLHLQNAVYIGSVTTSPSYQIHLSGDSAGKPSTNVWTVVSDDRTKATIKPFKHGLDAIRAFPLPIEFTYNGEYGTPVDDVPGIGYSAQDVLAVAPKMIRNVKAKRFDTDVIDDDIMGVNTGALVPMLHLAILELDKRIETLESKQNANNRS